MVDTRNWPDRIKSAYADLQYQSELIVTGVQLGIITLLFVVITVTPIGYSPDAPIRSALFGLSLFTVLVLLRYWLVITDQLNPTLLGISVVLEMTLLLFTIWTYFIQFESVPSINLKNSHFNYIFILIALRTLRFEPIWVILSGVTAICGWSFIVWHTLDFTTMQSITWDYVTYASTQSIYLGAEFDKILSIALVTLVLALTLFRAQQTLALAVNKSFATDDLSKFFDEAVAKKITQSNLALKAGQAEKREAVIVFIDLRGFSKLSETATSKELIELLGEYQQLLVPIIRHHQGSIDKFMGDGILASFGAVIPSKTYAADALCAVSEMLEAIQSWQEARKKQNKVVLNVGMGLAEGEVLFGLIGDENRLEYTVIGETVNLAAKLEKHNKVEKANVLASKMVLDKALAHGYQENGKLEVRKQIAVAGVNELIDLVVIS